MRLRKLGQTAAGGLSQSFFSPLPLLLSTIILSALSAILLFIVGARLWSALTVAAFNGNN